MGYWLAVGIIIAVGAHARFTLPAYPFADPDSWGYLSPSLNLLAGGKFSHLEGRSFPYPLFLYGVQRLFGGLNTIAVAQHVIGLLSGGLLLWVWHRMACFQTLTAATWIAHRFLGCVILAVYLLACSTVTLEHSIRPEALFPFFTLLAVAFAVEYCTAFYLQRNLTRAFLFGAVLVFDSLFIYFLKPAWGLATLAVIAPVVVSWFQLRGRLLFKVGVIALPAAVAFVALWLPERRLIREFDPWAVRFLPASLFVYHAPMVRDEIAADLAKNEKLLYPRNFLESIVTSIDNVPKGENDRCFPVLGFNPERLMAQDSVYGALERTFQPESNLEYGRFCMHYFIAAWRHQPRRMLMAAVGQMQIPNSSPYRGPFESCESEVRISECAAQVMRSFHPGIRRRPYKPFDDYLAFWRARRDSTEVWRQGRMVATLHNRMRMLYTESWGLLLVAVIGCGCAVSRGELFKTPLFAASIWGLYLFSFNFWNNLSIALTVSTEYNRYLWSQLCFVVLAEAWAILVFWNLGPYALLTCAKAPSGA